MGGEPSLGHLERIAHRRGGAVRIGGVRLHVSHVQDVALRVDEGDGQGQGRVLHPEATVLIGVEHKQHPVVGRQGSPIHQSI